MIIQLGALFGSIGKAFTSALPSLLEAGVGIGQQFLQREFQRKDRRAEERAQFRRATAVANLPPISVAQVGSTNQPIGGPTFRSTFVPARSAPVFNSFGNLGFGTVPVTGIVRGKLGPVIDTFAGGGILREAAEFAGATARDIFGSGGPEPVATNGTMIAVPSRIQRFARNPDGSISKFFCSPRPREGWINVRNASAVGLKATKPFARFDRMERRFVTVPRRRINPLNIRALGRAKRREDGFMEIVLPMIKQRNKERSGACPSIRAKKTTRRRTTKKRKRVTC